METNDNRKHFMPIWQEYKCGAGENFINQMADSEERAAALAAHLYFQGKLEEAARTCAPLIKSESVEICLSALLIHRMACVPLGDTVSEHADEKTFLRMAQEARTDGERAILRFIQAITGVFFHTDEKLQLQHIDWMGVLPEGIRLFALYGLAHGLYLNKDYAQALGIARSALILADDRFPSVCIYLNLMATIAAMNLNQTQQADGYFLRAWTLAAPDGYLHPFAEHHGMLQGQVEKHFRDKNPAVYRQIAEMVVRFSRGWMKIHNRISANQVTDVLTPYEFSIAMLAAKGKSNAEIAEYMNVSVSTVKAYLTVIYQKVGVASRAELAGFVNK